jgi:alpha-1,2-mannosyltransferase
MLVVAWLNVFPVGKQPYFIDLESYRDTLDGVARGDLMYDWLGYPPITLIVLSPLRGLPPLAGDRLWTGGTIVMALVLAAGLAKLTTPSHLGDPRAWRRAFLTRFGLAGALLLISFPMTNQLATGQITLLVVTLAFLDASGLLRERLRGSLVGLAAALKLLPLSFFPFYVITKQWRALALAVASFGVTTAIGFALFPVDSAYFWTHVNSSERLGPGRADNLSVFGLLNRWLADPSLASWVWFPVAAGIGILAYIRARQHFLRGEQVQAALVIGCASTAISPIAWPHYQVWLVLTALWLILCGDRTARLAGMLVYLAHSVIFVYVVFALREESIAARLIWEVMVIIPVLISALGLPHTVQDA